MASRRVTRRFAPCRQTTVGSPIASLPSAFPARRPTLFAPVRNQFPLSTPLALLDHANSPPALDTTLTGCLVLLQQLHSFVSRPLTLPTPAPPTQSTNQPATHKTFSNHGAKMVKFYSQNETYAYPFPAVTLAYFLRYPNPYSTHVLSTDTIARSYDPETQRLTTIRLHLKRSKLPSAVLKLLPRSLLGASASGDTQSYILERSVVDMKEGVMDTESRNLEWTGVLSVVERQVFKRPTPMVPVEEKVWKGMEGAARRHGFLNFGSGARVEDSSEATDVISSVTLHSHIGEAWKKKREAAREGAAKEGTADEDSPKMGFFRSWGTAALQRNIEKIGLTRAQRSQPNAREGMKVVLERMRQGGLVAVLEGMRQDREAILAGQPLKVGKRGDDE